MPAGASLLPPERLADRIRGLVFGAALGDAAGLATEFLSRKTVEEFYGEGFPFSPQPSRVLPDTHRMMWAPGDWTDDTDQLVLILQSLLHTKGLADPSDFARRMVRWQESGFQELGDGGAAGLGQHTKHVLSNPNFVTAPHETAFAVWENGGRKNAANGAVMRTAVTGVPFFWSRETVIHNTISFCKTTHADPRCVASCLVVALCVSEMLMGVPTDTRAQMEQLVARAVAVTKETVADDAVMDELTLTVEATTRHDPQSLRDLELDDPHKLGYTFKCLGSGVWALNSETSFESTMRQIVSEGGDADTNCAVAGALLGCRLGFSQLPSNWVAELQHSSWLDAYAQKLLFMLQLR
ncbi:hypothetical protein AB1Y20_003395 [Prymnesium parvum]